MSVALYVLVLSFVFVCMWINLRGRILEKLRVAELCVVLERIEAAAVRDTPDVHVGSFGVETVCREQGVTYM